MPVPGRRLRSATPLAIALAGVIAICGCGPGAVGSSPPAASPADRPRALLVDTDVAADDLVALAFLIASPDVEIQAITVSGTGEAHCESGVDIVLRLLERLNAPAIDVACGRETPIAGGHAFPEAWRTHVDGGSGLTLPPSSRPSCEGDAVALIRSAAEQVAGLHVLTLGPLTNLADALAADPELAGHLGSVDVMGGALHVPGNVQFGGPSENQVAEWNVYVDPVAAAAVIASGLPVRLVSLDGTNQVPVTPEYAGRVAQQARGPGALLLAELLAANPFMADGTYYLWDPLAAALAAGYPLGTFSAARIEIDVSEGPESGFTRPVDGAPNVEYLSSADPTAAEDTLMLVLDRSAAVTSRARS